MTIDREFLDAADVKALTGESSPERQATALSLRRIPHQVVGRRVLVSRYHVRQWLTGAPLTPTRKPNLAAVR